MFSRKISFPLQINVLGSLTKYIQHTHLLIICIFATNFYVFFPFTILIFKREKRLKNCGKQTNSSILSITVV